MATHRSLSEFNSSTTSWQSCVDQLNHYFVASDIIIITDKTIRLSACGECGPATFKTIQGVVDAKT